MCSGRMSLRRLRHSRMTPDQIRAFEAHALSLKDRYHIPGLAVAIAQDGDLAYGRGFGYREVEQSSATTLDTVFGVASVTKSFTALAIMQLQDAGLLSSGDPVTKYLPEFRTPDPDGTRQVTIRHFLTHTAGLPPLALRWFVPPIDTYELLMERIVKIPWTPLGRPGQFLSYSHEGYALLGAIIEKVSGLSYVQYIQDRILRPAGLTHTGFDPGALGKEAAVTTLYAPQEQRGKRWVTPTPAWGGQDVWLAAGGACSTARDLIRYLEVYRTGGMVNGERVVSRKAVEEMTRPQVEVFPGRAYGYGLAIVPDYHGCHVVEHGGGRPGISAHVMVVRERGITAAVLANLAGLPARLISWGALNVMLGLPVDSPSWVFPDQTYLRNRMVAYIGEYRSEEGMAIQVTDQKTGLVFDVDGRQYFARPIGDDAFAVRGEDQETFARFLVDARGGTWGLCYGLSIIPRRKSRFLPGLALAKSVWRRLRRRAAALQGP